MRATGASPPADSPAGLPPLPLSSPWPLLLCLWLAWPHSGCVMLRGGERGGSEGRPLVRGGSARRALAAAHLVAAATSSPSPLPCGPLCASQQGSRTSSIRPLHSGVERRAQRVGAQHEHRRSRAVSPSTTCGGGAAGVSGSEHPGSQEHRRCVGLIATAARRGRAALAGAGVAVAVPDVRQADAGPGGSRLVRLARSCVCT